LKVQYCVDWLSNIVVMIRCVADELSGEAREERDRVRQLTEEATQTQLLRHSLHEASQELLELRVTFICFSAAQTGDSDI
jgi:hypothetical protein